MDTTRVMVGYDGSVAAGAAIEVAAALLPQAYAWVTYVWSPPFADEAMRRRLWHGTNRADEFVAAIEREGAAEAGRLAAMGVALARAAGWEAESLVERGYSGDGVQLAELAEKLEPDVIVLGARGLSGARAVLGSVSDMAVHYAPGPVLVVPHPLLSAERAALARGPILVGWDGSAGASHALDAAASLFDARQILLATIDGDDPEHPIPPGHEVVTAERAAGRPVGRATADALAHRAAECRAAAIVVGSRGRSAVREILLGSVAMATLHHTARPVVVVPHPARGGHAGTVMDHTVSEGGTMSDIVDRPPTDRIEVTKLPARVVVGRRESVAVADLSTFFARAIPFVAAEFTRLGLVAAGPPTAVYKNEAHQVFDVTVGFPVEDEAPTAGDLVAEHLPGGRVVRAEHVGPYRTLPKMYALLGAWFADHGRTPPRLMWEEYLAGPGTVDESEYRTRVVYPLA